MSYVSLLFSFWERHVLFHIFDIENSTKWAVLWADSCWTRSLWLCTLLCLLNLLLEMLLSLCCGQPRTDFLLFLMFGYTGHQGKTVVQSGMLLYQPPYKSFLMTSRFAWLLQTNNHVACKKVFFFSFFFSSSHKLHFSWCICELNLQDDDGCAPRGQWMWQWPFPGLAGDDVQ